MANKPNKKRRKAVTTRSTRSGGSISPLRLGLLDFIARYLADNRCAPTYEEIASGVGLKSVASVHFHINKLALGGYLTHEPQARSLQLTDTGRKLARIEAA